MVREWYLSWGTKFSSKKGGGTKGSGGGGVREKKSAAPPAASVAAAAAAGGCVNAVVHMFDFSHLHLCLHPHNDGSYLVDDPTPLKGVEAPRNSLETEELEDDSLRVLIDIRTKMNRRDTRLKLVQTPRGKIGDISSESSCSRGAARTPTLVARLMGLETLPESCNTTPRSSSSLSQISHSSHIKASTPRSRAKKARTKRIYSNDVPGPRSLPETPRLSSSQRRRSTDVVENHRLSLQINKENSIVMEMESARQSCSAINTKRREGRNYEDGNKSPRYYARQIMKQVKETVSRRVGVDITNTTAQREHRRDEFLLNTSPTTTKSKKSKKAFSLSSTPSPKSRRSETSTKLCVISENIPASESAKSAAEVVSKTVKFQSKPFGSKNEEHLKQDQPCYAIKKNIGDAKPCSKKLPPKTYDAIRNKKDEQFIRPMRANASLDKKCKKTPLSSELLHGSVSSLGHFKKDNSSSAQHPPTKFTQKQEASSKAQLSKPITNNNITSTTTRSSCRPSLRTYGNVHEEAKHTPAVQEKKDNSTATTTTGSTTAVAEFQYISRILKSTGIERDTPISFTRWFSTTNPLDPSIFAKLETAHYLTLTDLDTPSDHESASTINRRLIFHLVDEILADILRPHIRVKPWSIGFLRQDYRHCDQYHHQQQQQINGFQLVRTLCTRIRSFPSAECQTLQDIDALVEKDLPKFGAASNLIEFEEEGETIVSEIEREIMDSLVQEIAAFV